MTFELVSEHGKQPFQNTGWEMLIDMALRYGWKPTGTQEADVEDDGYDEDNKGAIQMHVEIKSTVAKVRDHQKAREIIDSYGLRNVEIKLYRDRDGCALTASFAGKSFDWWHLPTAIHMDQWPTKEEFPDEDDWNAELLVRHSGGGKVFLGLLSQLAFTLDTPLEILAVCHDEKGPSAHMWSVQPGAMEVQTLHAGR